MADSADRQPSPTRTCRRARAARTARRRNTARERSAPRPAADPGLRAGPVVERRLDSSLSSFSLEKETSRDPLPFLVIGRLASP